jgi:HSP90 family molecular chaperone
LLRLNINNNLSNFSSSGYGVEEATRSMEVGTNIELYIFTGHAEKSLTPSVITEVVDKYSSFVTVPILVNGVKVNRRFRPEIS